MEYNEQKEEVQEKKNGFRRVFFIGLIVILLLVGAVLAGILVLTGVKQEKYASAIEMANHYYKSGDFANAVRGYEDAIKIDKTKDTAYRNLASVYISAGNYADAEATLNRGMLEADSELLQEFMDYLNALEAKQLDKTVLLSDEQIREASAEITLEYNIFDMAAAYTYTEYFRDYGYAASAAKSGEELWLTYPSAGFTAVYYNLEKERVLDNAGTAPLANAKPNKLSFDNLSMIFSSKAENFAVSYEKLQELFGEGIKFVHDSGSGRYYITAEYKDCRISVETDEKGNVVSETAWNEVAPLNREKIKFEDDADGEVKGYVQNAVTGKGMSAVLKVREHKKKAGQPIKELTSMKDGSWSYAGKSGKYTIEVSAKGYLTEYFDIEIVKGNIKTGVNFVISPEVAEGEIRIVLTWGSSPVDLDSYAIGKSSDGKNFNINFTNKNVANVGELDVDDTSGYGPETITITDAGAEFTYSVMDFRLEGTMGGSRAKVKVYLPGKSAPVTYQVPSGEGNLWEVFSYKNGKVHPINKLYTDVNTSSYYKGD